MADNIIQKFVSGTHNVLDDENIPKDAASDSENWITLDGRIELVRGREKVGVQGVIGETINEHFGYTVDGTRVHFRKIGAKIQYFNGTAWVDVITGLTATAKYSFNNYSSLAGTFVFITGVDGIYKIHTAFPASSISLYDSTKNFKGQSFIDRGRMLLWNTPTDKTGLYGSRIDSQDSNVYTTVSGEATTSFSGTLGFKSGNPKGNAFGIVLTLTGTGEVYTDNYQGVLTGSLGGTGTINYVTGAYTISNIGVGTVNYQWENSNAKGITDFTKSATRLASEGFVVRQDEGGDAILIVLLGPDSAYYSIKKNSSYRFEIDATDLNPTNELYRKDIGVPSSGAAVSMGLGIVFMNTSNPEKSELTILKNNPLGDSVEPTVIAAHFKFENYYYDDDTQVNTYNRFIIVFCKASSNSLTNDKMILINVSSAAVDVLNYSALSSAKDNSFFYTGSSVSQTTYKMFVDFDDDGTLIDNFWEGRGELFGSNSLKKYRKQRLMGLIDPSQSYQVYIDSDGGNEWQLVGTVLGNAEYVDLGNPQTIGSNMIGEADIGGEMTTVYPYFCELKIKVAKFRKRKIRFVALGYGYVSVNNVTDHDILGFEERIPKRFRSKQNVSLDGKTTDEPTPEY